MLTIRVGPPHFSQGGPARIFSRVGASQSMPASMRRECKLKFNAIVYVGA
jgi:hypothetical protein